MTWNNNIVVLQGPRGPDGVPGPQGVAGATVSLSDHVEYCCFYTKYSLYKT